MTLIVSKSESKVKKVSLYIRAGSAEAGPPLGTVLGNLGVNSSKFCKEFNAFTENLPNYFKLKVEISVYENRNFLFKVHFPSTASFISLLKFEKTFEYFLGNFPMKKKLMCIFLKDLIKLAKMQFPY
ncbi:hypothetical protein GW796_10995 [archaeon]|nr:hypothetical protein [archaeon]